MAVKATPYIKALQAIVTKPISERLELLKSIIPTAEKGEVKNTDGLLRGLVRVLTSVTKDPDATAEDLAIAAEFRSRVEKFDPRENEKTIDASVGNWFGDEIAPTSKVSDTGDVWTRPGPPDTEEVLRIAYIVRDHIVLAHGFDQWRDGTKINDVLDQVLDGRERNTTNLHALFGFMEKRYDSGIRCLVGSVLHRTVSQILRDRGALPPKDPNEKTYGQKFLEELEALA